MDPSAAAIERELLPRLQEDSPPRNPSIRYRHYAHPRECARTVPTSARARRRKKPNSAEALKARKEKSKRKREKNKEAISLLSGILYYFKKMGRYPFENMVTMNHFVCNLPYIHGNPTEVRSKIEKLRKKYKKLWKKHGDNLMIMDPLGHEAFQLWKEIWGKKPTDDQQQPQQQPNMDLSEQTNNYLSMYPFLKESMQSDPSNLSLKVLPEAIVNEGLGRLKSSEMEQFDGEWRELQMKEIELYLMRISTIKNQTQRLLDIVTNYQPQGDDESLDDQDLDEV
ncbi:hypothetical protein VitviT2T_029747 [Vitis vinifera]|uniref:Glabrous enhancer-binding protein-like DBD domain-containing protein n=2 Tax=Vitis vinifera TaxID=29760 RepID=A0ABY9DYE9_VITVI|nr:uncharacterized protein LOC104877576 [Vitis vinifera]WKA12357.1 hypothetical protein VitviT2T_029747 [Vitis vinifera]|eukprot:XP_010644398.1 PREDICTED: uncharacterized protein LOC104877576 [Vitis vinifera]